MAEDWKPQPTQLYFNPLTYQEQHPELRVDPFRRSRLAYGGDAVIMQKLAEFALGALVGLGGFWVIYILFGRCLSRCFSGPAWSRSRSARAAYS